MKYGIKIKYRRIYLKLYMIIKDLRKDYFIVKGRSDSNYITNSKIRKSVTGLEVTLNGVLVIMRIISQYIITLSITKAELIILYYSLFYFYVKQNSL